MRSVSGTWSKPAPHTVTAPHDSDTAAAAAAIASAVAASRSPAGTLAAGSVRQKLLVAASLTKALGVGMGSRLSRRLGSSGPLRSVLKRPDSAEEARAFLNKLHGDDAASEMGDPRKGMDGRMSNGGGVPDNRI